MADTPEFEGPALTDLQETNPDIPWKSLDHESQLKFLSLSDRLRKAGTNPDHIDLIAFDEAKEFQDLNQKGIKDKLTGLDNRGRFDEALEQQLAMATRGNRPLTLTIFDLDHFKDVNDTYGHLAGDQVLRELARRIKDTLKRRGDIAARYGGEEFALILPDTDETGASIVIELIREAVLKTPFDIGEGRSINVNFSAGVRSLVPTRDTTPEQIIKNADDALYNAKESGRGRSLVWQEGMRSKPKTVNSTNA